MEFKAISARARGTTISPMRILAPAARRARDRGIKVYHLNLGQPFLSSPASFFTGLQRLQFDQVGYEETQGARTLREAWSNFMQSSISAQVLAENILITNGASEAVLFAISACCDAGDEILVFDPSYANYLGLAIMAGVNLVPISRRIEDGFEMPPIGRVAAAVTPKTKALLICNPDNPTGVLYDKKDLELLLDLCHDKKLYLIVDEVYREFVYEGLSPYSILNIAPKDKRIILIDSFSKRFSLCGTRIGSMITFNEQLLIASLVFASLRLSAPVLEQYAATHMLNNLEPEYLRDAVEAFSRQRDALCETLEGGDIFFSRPKGAFYVTARLPVKDSLDFAAFMLNDFSHDGETVFITPAGGFYFNGDGGFDEVRLAFVLEERDMSTAGRLLLKGLGRYKASGKG